MTREECARERVETGRPDPRIGIPDHYSTFYFLFFLFFNCYFNRGIVSAICCFSTMPCKKTKHKKYNKTNKSKKIYITLWAR